MLNLQRNALRAADRLLPLTAHVPRSLQRLLLQEAANRLFARPVVDGEFDILRGNWLRLEIADLKLGWNLTHVPGGLRLVERCQPSVTIRGNWRDFVLLASRREDPDTLFFRRRLLIEGDTELGLAIKNLIDSLDPDDLPGWLWKGMQKAGDAVQKADA